MERVVLKKAASASFLGDQQDPLTGTPQKLRRKKARMEDGALETVRKLGEHASLIQTLALLREMVVVSLLKVTRLFFFLSDLESINHKFSQGRAADWCQPSGHLPLFCEF